MIAFDGVGGGADILPRGALGRLGIAAATPAPAPGTTAGRPAAVGSGLAAAVSYSAPTTFHPTATPLSFTAPVSVDPGTPAAAPLVVPSSPSSLPAPTAAATLTPAADPSTSGGALGLGVVSSLSDLLGRTFGSSTAAQSANSGNLQPLAVQSTYPATATADASAPATSAAGGLRWGRLLAVVLVAVLGLVVWNHVRHGHALPGTSGHAGGAHV